MSRLLYPDTALPVQIGDLVLLDGLETEGCGRIGEIVRISNARVCVFVPVPSLRSGEQIGSIIMWRDIDTVRFVSREKPEPPGLPASPNSDVRDQPHYAYGIEPIEYMASRFNHEEGRIPRLWRGLLLLSGPR